MTPPSDLERALAQFTLNRFVVRDRHGRYLDTSITSPDDVILLDRVELNHRIAAQATLFRAPVKG